MSYSDKFDNFTSQHTHTPNSQETSWKRLENDYKNQMVRKSVVILGVL